MTAAQMRGLADIARSRRRRYPADRLAEPADLRRAGRKGRGASAAIEALGLSVSATLVRAGLVACTGNGGCKFAAADTKGHAWIARMCEARRRARPAGQHPPDRLPPLLRPALYRRHRPDRPPRCRRPTTATGRGLSRPTSAAASAPSRHRPRALRDVKARGRAGARSSGCCGPIWHRAEPDESFVAFAAPPRDRGAARLCSRERGDMSMLRARHVAVLPETAPFTPEQRAWLNGFFAGLLRSTARRHSRCSPADAAALMPARPPSTAVEGDDGERPGTTRRWRWRSA